MQSADAKYMRLARRLALRLARRAYGLTSPNPMVGAVLVKSGRIIGKGWHRRAGMPHAEIEAINDATEHGEDVRGSILCVTLEPCCTTGRTPPCTDAIIRSGIREVIAGATDPNPRHAGRGFELLRKAGVRVQTGVLECECVSLNEAFNHWIVRRTPLVTVKAAMTLDGKIATEQGQSKWITEDKARVFGMRLRQGSDAIAVGINTVLADNPSLTVRGRPVLRQPLRVILDPRARTPLTAALVLDAHADRTLIVVGREAPLKRIRVLERHVNVLEAPSSNGKLNLKWVLRRLGAQGIVSLLVEGGGEANASLLLAGLAHRIAFFYAPKVLGGRSARRGVGGDGAALLAQAPALLNPRWRLLDADLLLQAEVKTGSEKRVGVPE